MGRVHSSWDYYDAVPVITRAHDCRICASCTPPPRPGPADQQFRLLVSSVTDYAIYLLDGAGRVTSWNPGAERMMKATAPTRSSAGISRSSTSPRTVPEAAPLRAARRPSAARAGRLRKDGNRFWALAVIDAVRDDAGELVGFAKTTRDISERRDGGAAARERGAARAFTSCTARR